MLPVLDSRVQICVGGVLSPAAWAHIAQPATEAIVGIQVLKVCQLWVAGRCGRCENVVLKSFAAVSAIGDIDRPVVSVVLTFSGTVICFELCFAISDYAA